MSENEEIEASILQRVRVMKKLGSGAYGHVWKVKSKGERVSALKKIFQAFQNATDAQRTYREISILRKLCHKNIIKLEEVLPSLSKRDVYLLFEYMSTDLYRGIHEGMLEEVHHKYIIYQILLALHYLHSAQLIHRDLKPSNILINESCLVKICDFGLVRFLGSPSHSNVPLTEGVATRWYRAPEVLLGSSQYDSKADMWSLGCIISEMVLKNPLFPGNSTLQQLEKILQFTGKPLQSEILELHSQSAWSIIKECQQVKPKTTKEVFGTQVNPLCIDLITKLLLFSSHLRLTADQALRHPYLADFFKEADLLKFQGEIAMQIDDNIKVGTAHYISAISSFYDQPLKRGESPLKFSDLKKQREGSNDHRGSSFSKLLENITHSRKNSHDKSIKFSDLLSKNSQDRAKKSVSKENKENAKENANENKDYSALNAMKQFSGHTFGALRKTSGVRHFK